MSCMAVSIHVRWGRPMGLGWPGIIIIRVARDGVCKKQLLDHDIIRLAGCVPQPPDYSNYCVVIDWLFPQIQCT